MVENDLTVSSRRACGAHAGGVAYTSIAERGRWRWYHQAGKHDCPEGPGGEEDYAVCHTRYCPVCFSRGRVEPYWYSEGVDCNRVHRSMHNTWFNRGGYRHPVAELPASYPVMPWKGRCAVQIRQITAIFSSLKTSTSSAR